MQTPSDQPAGDSSPPPGKGLSPSQRIEIGILLTGLALYLVVLGANVAVPHPSESQKRVFKLGESLSAGAFMAGVTGLTSSQFQLPNASDTMQAGLMFVGGVGTFALVYNDFGPLRRRGAAAMIARRALPPNTVFISYRRDDQRDLAGWLNDRLKRDFGDSGIYFDTDDIHGGDLWRDKLTTTVASCDVLLAVIGPKWDAHLVDRSRTRAKRVLQFTNTLDADNRIKVGPQLANLATALEATATSAQTITALTNELETALGDRFDWKNGEEDWVVFEIGSALQGGKQVIPLLLSVETIPDRHLPKPLAHLTDHNSMRILRDRFETDIDALASQIDTLLKERGR